MVGGFLRPIIDSTLHLISAICRMGGVEEKGYGLSGCGDSGGLGKANFLIGQDQNKPLSLFHLFLLLKGAPMGRVPTLNHNSFSSPE